MCLLISSFLQHTLPYISLEFHNTKEIFILNFMYYFPHISFIVFNSRSGYYVLGINYDLIIFSTV